MKKRLEADLVSIAHRILQLKNKSDINQLFLETQKLYEKLSVLRFVDEQYGEVKPTIGQAEIEKDIEAFYDRSNDLAVDKIIENTEIASAEELPKKEVVEEQAANEEIPVEEAAVEAQIATQEITEVKSDTHTTEITAEDVHELGDFAADITEQPIEDVEAIEEEFSNNVMDSEEIAEEKEEIIAESEELEDQETEEEPATEFKSAFELTEEIEVETPMKAPTMQITFEDLLGGHYSEPEFVKVNEVETLQPEMVFEAVAKTEEKENIPTITAEKTHETKTVSINDKFSKGINIDLNDQIAFVKHLFGNSNEDYNRVLNQLITFDNFYETRNFIEEMVKPDYNNWDGKADYEERFMDIIEKKFL